MVHAQLHYCVDVLTLADPMIETEDRLVDHRQQNPIGDKPWEIIRLRRCLAETFSENLGCLVGLVRGGKATDNLHKLHHRDRIHKMHADNLVGSFGPGRNSADRDRRGVGGQNKMLTAYFVQRFEELEFDLLVFEGRFDHKIGNGHLLQIDTGRDAS